MKSEPFYLSTLGPMEAQQWDIFEELIPHLPRIYAADHAVRLAAGGIPVKIKGVESYEETVEAGKEAAVVTLKGELIGIGVACEPPGKIKGDPEAVIVRLKTCFLDVASYPHFSEYLPPDDTDTCMLSGD